ncbi:MAG: hypothetical protein EOM14_05890 [Clostridia bacterium]|nr:hypothetical protein [Clostridia bacterium]
MTKEIQTELRRLIALLPKTDPCSDEYIQLLRSIEVLGCGATPELAEALAAAEAESAADGCDTAEPEAPKLTDISKPKTKKAAKAKATPEPEPEPAPEPEETAEPEPEHKDSAYDYEALGVDTEDGKPTKAGMRAYLGRAKLENGIAVADLLSSLGYSNLSAVPAEDYDKLIGLVEDAKAGN